MSTTESAPRAPSFLTFLASAPSSWFWLLCVDLYPALAAFFLPWSTSAVAIFMVVWLIVLFPTINGREFLTSLKRAESFLPIVFFALAVLGMLWAEGPWGARFQGLHPVSKLLAIPLLLYHFGRSRRSSWIFIAFFSSCVLLMGFSWIMYFVPSLKFAASNTTGVPVKNYIDQSYEFSLCLLAAGPLLLTLVARNRWKLALCCAVLLLGFSCNMMFVAVARTAFVYLPVLLVAFAVRYLKPSRALWLLAAGPVIAVLVWFTSPYVRYRADRTIYEYRTSQNTDAANSAGERLAYWRASIGAIEKAPLFGRGTGSTKQVLAQVAEGKTGEWANSIRNPHNQTLYVVTQWGVLGGIVLYAMWYFHLSIFLELTLAGWIGLVVVAQNFVSSIFNSHLFDFHEGWIYVLGVGVAGGMALRAKSRQEDAVGGHALPQVRAS
jgi:O-antigen ligase